jgi:hypothetical protein
VSLAILAIAAQRPAASARLTSRVRPAKKNKKRVKSMKIKKVTESVRLVYFFYVLL